MSIALAFITLGFVINRIKDCLNVCKVWLYTTLPISHIKFKHDKSTISNGGLDFEFELKENEEVGERLEYTRPVLNWLSDITIGKLEEKILPSPAE